MAIHKIKVGDTTHDIQIGSVTSLAVDDTDNTNLSFNGKTVYFNNAEISAECSRIYLSGNAGDAYIDIAGDDAATNICGYNGVTISGGGPSITVDRIDGIHMNACGDSSVSDFSLSANSIIMDASIRPIKCIQQSPNLPAVECVYSNSRTSGWVSLFPGVMDSSDPSTEDSVGANASICCARPVQLASLLSYMDLSVLKPDGLWFSREATEEEFPSAVSATEGVYGADLYPACGIRVNSLNPDPSWSVEDFYNYGIDIVARGHIATETYPEIRLIAECSDDSSTCGILEFSPDVFRIACDIDFTTDSVTQQLSTYKTFIGGVFTAIGSMARFNNETILSEPCLSGYTPSNCVVVASGYGYLSNTSSYANAKTTSFIVVDGPYAATRRNSLRIASGKLYLRTAYQSSGAGITELFEWLDGNPDNEDRVGHFVTLVGEKIRYAEPTDNYVVGAVDPLPSVVGDNGEVWHGMYKRDVFGRALKEKVFVPKEVDEEGNVLWEDHYEEVEIQGEDFDPEKQFIERWERQEYSTISSKGKVVLIDDGTCQVDKFATVGPGGIATHSDDNVAVRVMKRVDENHVKVFIDAAFLIKH